MQNRTLFATHMPHVEQAPNVRRMSMQVSPNASIRDADAGDTNSAPSDAISAGEQITDVIVAAKR